MSKVNKNNLTKFTLSFHQQKKIKSIERQLSREERHIRMRSLSPAPNHLLMRSRSRSRCGPGYASSGKSQ